MLSSARPAVPLLCLLCVLALSSVTMASAVPPTQGTPLGVIVVTNAADSGAGTLRQALLDAQAGTTILFDPGAFPLGSPTTIALTSEPLPELSAGFVTVDASNAGVILDGRALAEGNGFGIVSNNNRIHGLQIVHFPWNGIALYENASYNLVGGSNTSPGTGCTGDCNVISSNDGTGVLLDGAGVTHNVLAGNHIGLDASGIQARPNHAQGVVIQKGASDNLVGGDTAAERNLIFGHHDNVGIWDTGTTRNTVRGNWIGLSLLSARQAFPADLAISPGYASDCTLLAATLTSGVHRSTDCGASWATSSAGLDDLALKQVEIPPDAADASTAVLLTQNGDLYRTTNGGAQWALVSTVLQHIDRRNLALSASFLTDQTLYASAEWKSAPEMGDAPGVFKSTDGGVTWARRSDGMSDDHVRKVIASPDPLAANTLVAITQSGIEKSTNGGDTWFTLSSPDISLSDLALSPNYAADQTILVGSYTSRIYRSTDGGTSWSGVDALRGDPRFLAFSPAFASDQRVCHGGGWNDWVYCSTDGGITWNEGETGLLGGLDEAGSGVAFSPAFATDATMFAISQAGLARSTDAGTTWTVVRSLHDLGGGFGVTMHDGATNNNIGPDNVISNNVIGVGIESDTATYNSVTENRIGTDPTGLIAQANAEDGVRINGFHNAVTSNLVAASLIDGVRVAGPQAVQNVVAGNFIGVDVTGMAALGNRGAGVSIHSGATLTQVGGDEPNERNIISGNGYGIGLWDSDTMSNTITGNFIGLDVNGGTSVPNGSGLQLQGGTHHNQIGGTNPGEGNVISGNWSTGVSVYDASYNTFSGNFIGLDAGGGGSVPNQYGVQFYSGAQHNLLGPGNVISGNHREGAGIYNTNALSNTIRGNLVGLDASGSYAVPNGGSGVDIKATAYNVVGGPTPADRNVISGNGATCDWCDGVTIQQDAHHNVVQGNYIGTDASGAVAIGNRSQGIDLWENARDNQILDNLVAANGENGITIWNGSSRNVVAGNRIGTDASGIRALPNGRLALPDAEACRTPRFQRGGSPTFQPLTGVGTTCDTTLPTVRLRTWECGLLAAEERQASTCDTPVPAASESLPNQESLPNGGNGIYIADGATSNTIGTDNTIAFNLGNGVEVQGSDALTNTITANAIHHNQGAGIALHEGGNGQLAPPHGLTVDLANGLVSGLACANCSIEIFSSSDEEGEIYEGTTTADGVGAWNFNAGHPLQGPNVTATATDAAGNTSPFASPFDLLVFDLNVPQDLEAIDRLGFTYTLVDGPAFATIDLAAYDVLYVGFTGNDPQPPNLLQPLLDRRDDIRAFVQAGGGLVANSEDGVVATPLDWQWVPVDVTHQPAGGQQMLLTQPVHPLAQGLTEALLQGWHPFHNTFAAWDWPEAAVVLTDPASEYPIVLAGPCGAGRMVLSGSDPDYHGEPGPQQLLVNEITWAAGTWQDKPPTVDWTTPQPGSSTADRAALRFSFSELISPTTLSLVTISVEGSLSGPVNGTLTYYPRNAHGVFLPAAPFIPGEQVTATLRAAIQDLTGRGLDGNRDGVASGSPQDDFVWSFSIRGSDAYVVTSTADSGPGTLRRALTDAQPGDTITFDPGTFPPGAPATIAPQTALPPLGLGYVRIDARNAGVILDGSALPGGNESNWGLLVVSDGNIVQGLEIVNSPATAVFIGDGAFNLIGGENGTPGTSCSIDCNVLSGNMRGVHISGALALGNVVSGNMIGTDGSGLVAQGNRENGITLDNNAQFNVIGGDTPAERNLIAGNDATGIFLDAAHDNRITGNFIGTNITGLVRLPNHKFGTELHNGSSHNAIGGRIPGEPNVISGHDDAGLVLSEAYWTDVRGNTIGLGADGVTPLGNKSGIQLWNSGRHNVIGGDQPGDGNLISANQNSGIASGAGGNPVDLQITGNIIGGDSDGHGGLGNGDGINLNDGKNVLIADNIVVDHRGAGIWLLRVSDSTLVGNHIGIDATGAPASNHGDGLDLKCSANNWIGAQPGQAEGNTIAYNDGTGIALWSDDCGDASRANRITQNSLFANGGLGIDLRNGSQDGILTPLVSATDPSAGTASGQACAGCTVEVFSDDGDEGRYYEGTTTADGGGAWTFAKGNAFAGSDVHVTAGDSSSNTSEFSGPPPIVTGVDPASGRVGSHDLGVWIEGEFFRDNPPLTASFGDGITVNGVDFGNRTKFKAYLEIDAGATLGPRTVSVTNDDGQTGMLTGGFVVTSTVPPPPDLSAVRPAEVAPGASGEILVRGSGFVDRPQVVIGGDGVSVDWWQWEGSDTVRVRITVDPGAAIGARSVTLTNPDGQSDTLPAGLTLVTPYFTDVAPALGLDVVGGENGAAWGDIDGNGWLDLTLGDGHLFKNSSGTFSDVTADAGLDPAWNYGGVAWGDYDNDGDLDLLSSWRKVYRQDSLGFSKVWDGGAQKPSLSWVDYDGDGDLDVFAAGRLYRNDGSDTFSDVTSGSGLVDSGNWAWSATWADYDDDADPDLYLGCVGCPNQLYRNNGDGTFGNVTDAAGVGDAGSAHGTAWGDFDNDGDLDLFVANNDWQNNVLYQNNGDGTFGNVTHDAGLDDRLNLATGANWIDYNLDGYLDLFVVNRDAPNRLYRNNGDRTFTDYGLASGVNDGRDSDGSTVGDYDNDGDPDVYVVSGIWGSTPSFLFRNNADPALHGRHWLKVQLTGTQSNHTGIGARVRVYGAGLLQTRHIDGSTGYMSQDAPQALFGLGSAADPVVVEVTWPTGAVQTLSNVGVDQVLTITEPAAVLHDVGVIGINQPKAQAASGTTLAPQATIRNLGAQPESGIPVRLLVESDGAPVYDQVINASTLDPAMSTVVTFPDFTFGGPGTYQFTFTSQLAGDQNPANDQQLRSVQASTAWVDLWTRDFPGDTGAVPSFDWWQSPDIWVRHANDGGSIHQDPIANTVNYVYVRVRNRGNAAASNINVDAYWHGPALGIVCGDWSLIGSATVPSLAAGGSTVVVIPWTPARSGHTCLHDVVYNAEDPVTFPCDVAGDNNIEQRNVEIIAGPVAGEGVAGLRAPVTAEFAVANIYPVPQAVDIQLTRGGFPLAGSMVLYLPDDLFDRWWAATGGGVSGGQAAPLARTITVTDPVSMTVVGLPMYAEERVTVTLELISATAADFAIELTEWIAGQPVGGSVYLGHTCQAEDLNCDGVIDVLDIQQAAGAWNSTTGEPGYSVWIDFDGDGRISVQDVMRVAGVWAAVNE